MPSPSLSRRTLMRHLAAGCGLAAIGGVPGAALATTPSNRRFVFVTAFGGWDPTRVFAPMFDSPHVSMEPDAERVQQGDLSWVRHDSRPSVDAWFDHFADRTLFLNGVVVPSVSHVTCTKLLYTASSLGTAPDWPSRLGHAQADRFALPQTVIAGPHYPNALGSSVTRMGSDGQVEALLRGDLLRAHDAGVTLPDDPLRALIDQHSVQRAERRLERAATDADAALALSFVESQERSGTLKGLVDEISFSEDGGFLGQVDVAVDLLRLDISRVVNLALADLTWDSHEENDYKQAHMFEQLFAGLVYLQQLLDETPAPGGGVLSDETVVVVLSEMGRTPHLNAGRGKDHWSHTSVMLCGGGVSGGRVIGGYSDVYTGQPVDPATGAVTDSGIQLSPETLGASLLHLGGVSLDEGVADDIADAQALTCIASS